MVAKFDVLDLMNCNHEFGVLRNFHDITILGKCYFLVLVLNHQTVQTAISMLRVPHSTTSISSFTRYHLIHSCS